MRMRRKGAKVMTRMAVPGLSLCAAIFFCLSCGSTTVIGSGAQGSDIAGGTSSEAQDAMVPSVDAEPDAGPSDENGAGGDAATLDATDATDAAETDVPDVGQPMSFPEKCFPQANDPNHKVWPDYNKFHPVYGEHCAGTHQQEIKNVEQVVFLGDSITAGGHDDHWPQLMMSNDDNLYPEDKGRDLKTLFGQSLIVKDCSEGGKRIEDLDRQFNNCITGPDGHVTLVLFTIGGNDLAALAGRTPLESLKYISDRLKMLHDFVAKAVDPAVFPNGSFVAFTNIYETTDGTGITTSCGSQAAKDVSALMPLFTNLNESYMQTAVDTKTDLVFMREYFCGHGENRADPAGPCYLGPNADLYFDTDCMHPNLLGHRVIARLFYDVVSNTKHGTSN